MGEKERESERERKSVGESGREIERERRWERNARRERLEVKRNRYGFNQDYNLVFFFF